MGNRDSEPCAPDIQWRWLRGSQEPSWWDQGIRRQRQSHVEQRVSGEEANRVSIGLLGGWGEGCWGAPTYLIWGDSRRKGWRGWSVRLVIHSLWRWEIRTRRLLLWRQGLAMSTVEHHPMRRTSLMLRISQVRIGSVGRNESLRLGRDRREHALLVEANTVAATAILRTLKTRASNLISSQRASANRATIRRAV